MVINLKNKGFLFNKYVRERDNKGGNSSIRKSKFAFTLAEVLITLSILGIVAAISIPNLVQRYTEKATVVKVKKFYSVLENAFTMATIDNGPISSWDIGDTGNTLESATKMYEYLKPYFQIQQDCGTKKGTCFGAVTYKSLNPNVNSNVNWNRSNGQMINKQIKLKDGLSVGIQSYGNAECREHNNCSIIEIDVNGPKGPNALGRDYFNFTIMNNNNGGYVKVGWSSGFSKCNINSTDDNHQNGRTCAQWVVYKGNMDYLHRDVSSEWNFK